MPVRVHIVKKGADHVEFQVDNEAAADLLADEAQKNDIKPVIGQRRGFENTAKHYVVLNGVADDILKVLRRNPKFELVST
jgi:hypothetical protein